VLPAVGFNCYSFEVPSTAGAIDVLWSDAAFAAGAGKPSHSGIPILFPFAGRIRGTSFEWQNARYELEAGDGQGNAIHGFVLNRPWRVTEQSESRVAATFQASVDDESLFARWPADFRITADYHVGGNTLTAHYTIDNPDRRRLPFALGTHPYFRVPLGGTRAGDCRVSVPVEYGWELEGLLPTGRTISPPVAGELARGMPFAQMKLDNVFGGLSFVDHRCTATVHDPASQRTTTLSFDDRFTTCVVYNPPHREAVCIEPYTTLPDPFSLQAAAIDPHLRGLAPGETFRTRIEIRLD
jgi:aldose 1-epimerase